DVASEKNLIALDKKYPSHNGGNVAFGPDGFLYVAIGDGGSVNDPDGNAQNPNVLFGKFLRLDVRARADGREYGIPPGNPFAAGGGRPEIFALGLRNPWRWSFDRETGEIWAGDVGQDAFEEVDRIELGGNYGWNAREATHWNPY